jgi:hypothetical protein
MRIAQRIVRALREAGYTVRASRRRSHAGVKPRKSTSCISAAIGSRGRAQRPPRRGDSTILESTVKWTREVDMRPSVSLTKMVSS